MSLALLLAVAVAAAPVDGGVPVASRKALTEAQAIEAARAAVPGLRQKVGGEELKGFESRVAGTEDERLRHSFVAKLVAPQSGAQEPARRFLYGSAGSAAGHAKVWVLEWKNLLSGGYVATLDAASGEVLSIERLIEG